MTRSPINDLPDGVWDDGEWISWHSINRELAQQERQAEYPKADIAVVEVFEELVTCAQEYRVLTGRYLQIWGELGELYAEIKYGIVRHTPGTAGSDGRLGNDWVEVKTISPEKNSEMVLVKRAGNFNKLLLVKISEDFEFQAKMISRKEIKKGKGKLARLKWQSDTE